MRIAHRRARAVFAKMGDWQPCNRCGTLTDRIEVIDYKIFEAKIAECWGCVVRMKIIRGMGRWLLGMSVVNLAITGLSFWRHWGWKGDFFPIFVMGPACVITFSTMLYDSIVTFRHSRYKRQKHEADMRAMAEELFLAATDDDDD